MAYENSELLKNYVHAYQVFGYEFYAHVARDIVRWMDEWMTNRDRGGFYASQDADINLDDDGDYFTWTQDEARAVLTPEELDFAVAYWDIGELGDMHHNPAKNVLYVNWTLEEKAANAGEAGKGTDWEAQRSLRDSARGKLLAGRSARPTPFIDRTLYTGWNAMAVTAYLETARVLRMEPARDFALKTLSRLLAEAWDGA